MEKANKTIDLLTAILIMVILCVPLLFFHRGGGTISKVDNRNTELRPVLADYTGFFDSEFPKDWDAYISDNMGCREPAILANIAFRYEIFGDFSVANYVQGKDGHLFYLTEDILHSYQGLDTPSQDSVAEICAKAINFQDQVLESGSQLIFMPIPNKEKIYSEFMPNNIHKTSGSSMTGSVIAELNQQAAIPMVNTEKALADFKRGLGEEDLLYYRNYDVTHWNQLGAFVGYQALMEKIADLDSSFHYLGRDDIFLEKDVYNGPVKDLAFSPLMSRVFKSCSDIKYTIEPKNGWNGISDNCVPDNFSLAGDCEDKYYHYYNPTQKDGKTLLIYGDSYIRNFLLPIISENFKDVYFLSYASTRSELAELLQYVDPDFVVFEAVDRMLTEGNLKIYLDNGGDSFSCTAAK